MTRITVTYGADALRLTARGHATGSPAACAAVSALLYALEGYLPLPLGEVPPQGAERACAESQQALSVACGDSSPKGGAKYVAAIAPGRADFVLPRTPAAEVAFDLVVTGLRRVAATVPAAVSVRLAAASSRETLNPANIAPHGSADNPAKERRST